MKNYEKPVVMVNEGLAEGVYAASGCWTIEVVDANHYDGTWKHFRVKFTHAAVEHISKSLTIKLTFNHELTGATGEFSPSASGNVVTITREMHANAYNNGDLVNILLQVKAGDEATTKLLECTGSSYSCDDELNVQGGGANGQ